MNECSAATRRLAKPMLLADDLAEISARWPEIAECFQSQKAYAQPCHPGATSRKIKIVVLRS
jgi:hypothetical protein